MFFLNHYSHTQLKADDSRLPVYPASSCHTCLHNSRCTNFSNHYQYVNLNNPKSKIIAKSGENSPHAGAFQEDKLTLMIIARLFILPCIVLLVFLIITDLAGFSEKAMFVASLASLFCSYGILLICDRQSGHGKSDTGRQPRSGGIATAKT